MITRHTDPALFRARVEPRLSRAEAENNLILGLLDVIDGESLLVEIDDGAAALRIPPFNLVVSSMQPTRIDALVDGLVDHLDGIVLPGVVGPADTARPLAQAWCRRHGLPARVNHSMRVFENHRVIAPRAPADGGTMRDAGVADLALVLEWFAAFDRDVGNSAPLQPAQVEKRLRAGDIVLWQTSTPVAMAAISRRTPHGAAVAHVYTPPHLRGRGYASACVAQLTQRLHDGGRLAYLFTDLANPTSNKIYRALGYVAICDFEEWRFD